jgi:hypothetical protein
MESARVLRLLIFWLAFEPNYFGTDTKSSS